MSPLLCPLIIVIYNQPCSALSSTFTFQKPVLLQFPDIELYTVFGDVANNSCHIFSRSMRMLFKVVQYLLLGSIKRLLGSNLFLLGSRIHLRINSR